MRLFIAISLDPSVQAVLAQFSEALKSRTGNSIRWVKSSNLHLTLKFLGEVDQSRVSILKDHMEKITRQFAPFDMGIQGCGVFPGWKQPRVIWAGVQAPEALARLSADLEADARTMGFSPEERLFSPHLTLGRVNDWISPAQKDALQLEMQSANGITFGQVVADRLTLYRSELRPDGPIYTELARSSFSLAS